MAPDTKETKVDSTADIIKRHNSTWQSLFGTYFTTMKAERPAESNASLNTTAKARATAVLLQLVSNGHSLGPPQPSAESERKEVSSPTKTQEKTTTSSRPPKLHRYRGTSKEANRSVKKNVGRGGTVQPAREVSSGKFVSNKTPEDFAAKRTSSDPERRRAKKPKTFHGRGISVSEGGLSGGEEADDGGKVIDRGEEAEKELRDEDQETEAKATLLFDAVVRGMAD